MPSFPCTDEDIQRSMEEVERRLASLHRALDENDGVSRRHVATAVLRERNANVDVGMSGKPKQPLGSRAEGTSSVGSVRHMVEMAKMTSAPPSEPARPALPAHRPVPSPSPSPPESSSLASPSPTPHLRAAPAPYAQTARVLRQDVDAPADRGGLLLAAAESRLRKQERGTPVSPFAPQRKSPTPTPAPSPDGEGQCSPLPTAPLMTEAPSPLNLQEKPSVCRRIRADSDEQTPHTNDPGAKKPKSVSFSDGTVREISSASHTSAPELPRPMSDACTVRVKVSGAELFALLRMREVITSDANSEEHRLPPQPCHTMMVSEEEHRQLLALRRTLQMSRPSKESGHAASNSAHTKRVTRSKKPSRIGSVCSEASTKPDLDRPVFKSRWEL